MTHFGSFICFEVWLASFVFVFDACCIRSGLGVMLAGRHWGEMFSLISFSHVEVIKHEAIITYLLVGSGSGMHFSR